MSFNYFPDILESAEPERLATGFKFTEGPLWHPDGFWYFVDLRTGKVCSSEDDTCGSASAQGRP